jgi:hypothetical protein
MHPGQGPGLSPHSLGESGGTETVTLLQSEMPVHIHQLRASGEDANDDDPPNAAWAGSVGVGMYKAPDSNMTNMAFEALRRPAAVSRTTICSPISPAISTSLWSASFRRGRRVYFRDQETGRFGAPFFVTCGMLPHHNNCFGPRFRLASIA